jgi:zinc finger protein 830
MADVRALLKAKRQEVRITHPYAAYGANGALRCTACGAAVKFASAWEGHLGSKAHRVAVANLRAKEEAEEARRATATTGAVSSKRKAEEGEDEDGEGEVAMAMATGKKRQRTVERDLEPDAGAHDTGTGTGTGTFPADFFSDPARAPPVDDDDGDDDDMDHHQDAKAKAAAPLPPPPPASKSKFDMEWDAFERDMQQSLSSHQRSSSRPAEAAAAAGDPQETYARATIAAEPELVVSRFEEGLPVLDGDGDGAGATAAQGVEGEEGGGRKVSGEELERRRKELDERELIMDRLMEEERAQEDAYGRVALLKNRVQMLKQKRELAKAKKGKNVGADMEIET